MGDMYENQRYEYCIKGLSEVLFISLTTEKGYRQGDREAYISAQGVIYF